MKFFSCVFCQQQSGELHLVMTFSVSKTMLDIAQVCDSELAVRLGTDPIANDIQYHKACLRGWERKREYFIAKTEQEQPDHERPSRFSSTVADIEFLISVVLQFANEAYTCDTNYLHEKYISILKNLAHAPCLDDFSNHHFKKHIKQLILDNVTGIEFVPSWRKNEPEKVCSKSFVSFSVDASIKTSTNSWILHQSAKILRKAILERPSWQFTGDFTNSTVCPHELKTFLKWLLYDNDERMTHFRKQEVQRAVNIFGEQLAGGCKTARQVNYQNVKGAVRSERGFYQKETALNIGTGLVMYSYRRSEKDVNFLHSLNMSAPYDKMLEIDECIFNYCCEKFVTEDGMYFPSVLSKVDRPYFAIDNADFKRDTKDGKNQLHATVIVVYQNKTSSSEDTESIVLQRTKKRSQDPKKHDFSAKIQICVPPKEFSTQVLDNFRNVVVLADREYQEIDFTHCLLQYFDDSGKVLTWKGYNSCLVDPPDRLTTIATLPLIKSPPTDLSTLYTALKSCQGISTLITPGKKTIITLDLQLYIKAMQLSTKDEIEKNYFFRIGELHAVFAMSKAIGRIIENSGFDKLFTHCGIYGPTTMSQILEGKHMKRCVAAYSILHASLFHVIAKAYFQANPESQKNISEDVVQPTLMQMLDDRENIRHLHTTLTSKLRETKFYSSFRDFRNSLEKEGKFMVLIMTMIETLLLYIRSTRQELWELQLVALERFAKFFFATDLTNYARMTPIYLSKVYCLRDSDRTTWDFLRTNFCCRKTLKSFTSIGVDHCLEQVNKDLKDTGGVVGLPDHLLDQYCIISPIKRQLVDQFQRKFSSKSDPHSQVHHELNKREIQFHNDAVRAYSNALIDFLEDSSLTFSCVFNTMTHSVLEPDDDLLNCEEIGSSLLEKFLSRCADGSTISVWDTINKRKLRTFRSAAKTVQVKVKDKIVNLREERGLMMRLLVLAKTRPDIELDKMFKKHEFSVTPRSLFGPDGSPWKCLDKSSFLRGIEEILAGQQTLPTAPTVKDVIVIDCMGIVNQLKTYDKINTLADLGKQFCERIEKECTGFHTIALVFDRYDTLKPSLKQQTWDSRSKKQQVKYNLTANTVIKNIKLNELLSHPTNKQRLCAVFAEQAMTRFTEENRNFVVAYGTKIVSTLPGWTHNNHDHDEADTLIICVSKEIERLSTAENQLSIRILSPDTDVLMLLIHYAAHSVDSNVTFELLSGKTRRELDIRAIVNKLGEDKAKGLLGAYVVTGCDQIGKFNSITKARAFTVFMDSSTLITNGLSQLGQVISNVSVEISDAVTLYVNLLYAKKKEDRDAVHRFKDSGELRWHLFVKNQQESDLLPPTPSALKFHIKRANYICGLWKSLSSNFNPEIEGPTDNGWEEQDGRFLAIMTDQLPAPEYSIELNSCNCKKTKCTKGKCGCSRNGLKCTDLCKCIDCENVETRFEVLEDEGSDE